MRLKGRYRARESACWWLTFAHSLLGKDMARFEELTLAEISAAFRKRAS